MIITHSLLPDPSSCHLFLLCFPYPYLHHPAADTLWVDKKNLRLKLWDGERWQTIGYEPTEPTEPTTPTEPETPDIEKPGGEDKDTENKEETDDKKTDQEGGSA